MFKKQMRSLQHPKSTIRPNQKFHTASKTQEQDHRQLPNIPKKNPNKNPSKRNKTRSYKGPYVDKLAVAKNHTKKHAVPTTYRI